MNKWVLYFKNNPLELYELVNSSNYQEFLKNYLKNVKAVQKHFSFGQLSLKCELSKTLIKSIFDGNRKLSLNNLNNFATSLKLPKVLEELFKYLVYQSYQSSRSTLLTGISTHQLPKLIEKFRALALELTEDEEFNLPANLANFVHLPYVYAALGSDQLSAVDLPTLSNKTKLDVAIIEPILKTLEKEKFIINASEKYYVKKNFLFFKNSSAQSFMHKLYIEILTKHYKLALNDFNSENHIFYLQFFSIQQVQIPEIKKKITDAINTIIHEFEDTQGDHIFTLQLGQF